MQPAGKKEEGSKGAKGARGEGALGGDVDQPVTDGWGVNRPECRVFELIRKQN